MAVAITKIPLDIDEKYYEPIGELIARMARIEHQVMLILGLLLKLKDSKQVRVSFMGMQMSARIATARTLAGQWAAPAIREKLCAAMHDARKLSELRNQLAHGVWGEDKADGTLRLGFADQRKYYLLHSKVYTPSYLRDKARSARAISKRLDRLIVDLRAAP